MTNILIEKLSEDIVLKEAQIMKCLYIYNESISESLPNHVFAKRADWEEVISESIMNWNSCELLISKNKEIIGFYLGVGNSLSKMSLLQLFAIDKNYQGNGYGRVLLEHYLDTVDSLGLTNKVTYAKKEMKDTLKFYQKIWGKIDFNNQLIDEYGDSIVKISFNKRPIKVARFKNN